MLITKSVEEFATHIHGVYAFRITGELTNEDLNALATKMNSAFDRMEQVDMLISFRSDEGVEFGAGFDAEVIKSQFRAITNVRNYCVAYAPDTAKTLIEVFDNILPVKATTFESEHNALEHLRAQEPLARSAA